MNSATLIQDSYCVSLTTPDEFDAWREAARRLVQAQIPPDRVIWTEPGGGGATLFAHPDRPLPVPAADAPTIRASRAFLALAQKAILHTDADRFTLLYGLLWRMQSHPRLIEDAADRDVQQLEKLARVVRRDIHKMHAFVRFRSVIEPDGTERFVAWFEPEHHILRSNAAFFVNRFTNMRWSILTPRGTLHWDGDTLREGPAAERGDAPDGDPTEDLWRRYYASTFNPARLKIGAMLKEMPRKYWKNMPEAALIPELVAGAQAREARMVKQGETLFGEDRPGSLVEVEQAISACRRCEIGCDGTRAVRGEGPADAALMIVGEQPGDNEEEIGRPFVGPAGQILDRHLASAGVVRDQAYLTNAVKHFKFTPRGKRRIHQTPTAREIDTCRWWLDSERGLVRPRHILALGASAGRSLLGRTPSIGRERGAPVALEDGSTLWLTVHPSYLLRLPDEQRGAETEKFLADLNQVAAAVRE